MAITSIFLPMLRFRITWVFSKKTSFPSFLSGLPPELPLMVHFQPCRLFPACASRFLQALPTAQFQCRFCIFRDLLQQQPTPATNFCLHLLRLLHQKYYKLGGLNNKHLSLTVLEAGKPKVKALAHFTSGESPLPVRPQMTILCILTERARELYGGSF